MKLYGSVTSPYVRRVRYFLLEASISFDFFDTLSESGQKELRSRNPIWKVPYLEDGEQQIWDSHAILDYLSKKCSWSIPDSLQNPWEQSNVLHAIDGALDSGINLFYLQKDGIDIQKFAYLQKQKERIGSILHWLVPKIKEHSFSSKPIFGIAELYLYTTLDWMRFRNVINMTDLPTLNVFLTFWEKKENLMNTLPG